MKKYDIIVVGAGPAGISAALAAHESGIRSIIVLDRLPSPGGILSQCLHRGFGKNGLNGIEYADELMRSVAVAGIEVRQDSTVTGLSADGVVTVFGDGKIYRLRGAAVVLATGARERPAGSLGIAGTRPAGVFTAGSVQRMINLHGYKLGNSAVILGSGDVGMIVAHHLTQTDVQVIGVFEKERYSSGLSRNKRLYLDSNNIPLFYETTVTELHGVGRLCAVTVCRVGADGVPMPETGRVIECDTLVTSVGLIPERELISEMQGGAEKAPEWLFVCGNAGQIYSLVEKVAKDGFDVGTAAAEFLAIHRG